MSEEKKQVESTSTPVEDSKTTEKPPTPTSTKDLSAEDLQKVKKQIEFYFSDSNYPKDKFLNEEAKKDRESFISIGILTTFNRLKAITTDLDQIRKAIKDSDVVVMNDDQTMLKRKHPVPEKLNLDAMTIFVKGLDREKSLDEVQEFFTQFGSVRSVRIIKDKKSKKSTGSAYIEMGTEEQAKELANKQTISWDNNTLSVLTKDAALAERKEKILGKRNDPEVPTYETGLLVKFTGLKEEGDFGPMDLKDFLKEQADVQYVEFIKGDTEGVARCISPEESAKLAASTTPFRETTLTYTVLEGEAEKMFWMRLAATKRDKRSGGGRGRGGRGRGGKRRY